MKESDKERKKRRCDEREFDRSGALVVTDKVVARKNAPVVAPPDAPGGLARRQSRPHGAPVHRAFLGGKYWESLRMR